MRSLRRIVMVLVLSLPAASAHAQSPGQPYSPPFPGQFPSQFPPGQFPGQFPGPDARPADPLDSHPCFSEDHDKHLKACTELLDQPGLAPGVRSSAHAMRALSLSILGKFDESIADYDAAIQLNPNFAVALNNRAWAYFKWGKPHLGLADVENSLALDSSSPHSYDTRAHIKQAAGDTNAAMADYNRAMFMGGTKMVKLYQCGLAAAGVYKGPADGKTSPALYTAFQLCVAKTSCDPLPADEECRAASS
jgi:tetratricopeptide (TPR) repeat protein